MAITKNATIASCDGTLLKASHPSTSLSCNMSFNIYLPFPISSKAHENSQDGSAKVPLLVYLSGLTCTPDNATGKGFFQRTARELGIAILYPDTSPRGVGIKGEDESSDFGTGAGFYVDAVKVCTIHLIYYVSINLSNSPLQKSKTYLFPSKRKQENLL